MFDKLIGLIQSFGKSLSPFFIINVWEKGIVLRGGKLRKSGCPFLNTVIAALIGLTVGSLTLIAFGKIEWITEGKGIILISLTGVLLIFSSITYTPVVRPGLHLKVPFLDKVWKHTVITQSIDLPPQSLTTLDGKNVVLKGIIRFSIFDIKKFLTTITQPTDVLIDTTGGLIRGIIENTRWNDVVDMDKRLTKTVGEFLRKWGVNIEKVTLTTLQEANTIRIIQDNVNQPAAVTLNEADYETE